MRQYRFHVLFMLSQFRKKNPVLPIEKIPSLQKYNNAKTPHYPFFAPLSVKRSGGLREIKNKVKFQTVSPKSGRDRLQDVFAYKKFRI